MESNESRESSSMPHRPQARACATCSRAKAKCIFGNNETQTCQRCHRLKKVCEPAIVRIRKRRRSHDRKNRVEKLEAKLDGLVTLIKSTQQNRSTSLPSPSTSFEQPSESAVSEFERHDTSFGLQTTIPDGQAPLVPQISTSSLHTFDPISKADKPLLYGVGADITGEEDPDELLTIFRTEIIPWFPFFSIPESIAAADLQQDRPFFYLSIIGTTTRNSARQSRLWKLLMQQIAERMFLNDERNLDILLGVLVYTGWFTNNFFNIPRFTSLISIATTLVGDLRLNKPPIREAPPTFQAMFRKVCGNPYVLTTVRTLEERRVFLGYFLLSSAISSIFQRLDSPPWTPYAEECCQHLSNSGRFDDSCAVALIRLQLIKEKVPQSLWHSNPEPVSSFPPPMLLSRSLEEQLKNFKRHSTPEIADKANIRLSYHNVEISIYRIGLSKLSKVSTFDELGSHRLEMLYSCLQAVKNFLDVFLAIPVSDYQGIPVLGFAQLTHALGTLQLLLNFEHPDWTLSWVDQTVSFSGVQDKLIERFRQAKATLGLDRHTTECLDRFSQAAEKQESMRRMTNESTGNRQNPEQPLGGDGSHYNAADSVNISDDAWIEDIFGPWDYQFNNLVN